jgi:hypothetical protein
MADTVDTKVVFNSTRIYVVKLINISDGTGESGVVKVDISTLIGPNGLAPTAIKVREILWSIQGFASVRLYWDHAVDDEIAVLAAGSGYGDWTLAGGLNDPRTEGGTGDIILTTNGAAAGNTYDITLVCELKD